MTVGVLVKEPTLVAALLVYGAAATRPVDRRLVARLAAWTAPSVVAAVAVRLALPGEAENTLAYGVRRLVDPTFTDLLNYTVVPWGVALLLLATAGAAIDRRMAVRLAPFAFAVYAQLLVARNDVRLVVLAFPAVLWLALIALERVPARAVLAAALTLAYVSVMSRPTVEFSLTREVAVAAVALAVGVAAGQSENRVTEKKLRPSASRVVAPPEVNTSSS